MGQVAKRILHSWARPRLFSSSSSRLRTRHASTFSSGSGAGRGGASNSPRGGQPKTLFQVWVAGQVAFFIQLWAMGYWAGLIQIANIGQAKSSIHLSIMGLATLCIQLEIRAQEQVFIQISSSSETIMCASRGREGSEVLEHGSCRKAARKWTPKAQTSARWVSLPRLRRTSVLPAQHAEMYFAMALSAPDNPKLRDHPVLHTRDCEIACSPDGMSCRLVVEQMWLFRAKCCNLLSGRTQKFLTNCEGGVSARTCVFG